jgi:hypothetical protein
MLGMKSLQRPVMFAAVVLAQGCGSDASERTLCDRYKHALLIQAPCDPEYVPPPPDGSYDAYRCATDAELAALEPGKTLASCVHELEERIEKRGGCDVPLGAMRKSCMSGLVLEGPAQLLSSARVGTPCRPSAVPTGGFSAAESYLLRDEASCAADACLVRGLQGDPGADCDAGTTGCPTEAEVEDHVYCTCRCDSADTGQPTCACPEGFRCEAEFTFGGSGLRGSYCAKRE